MDIEIATELLKSRAGIEIVKELCQLIGKTYDELGGKVANALHKYEKNYRERHGTVKVSCVGMRKPI